MYTAPAYFMATICAITLGLLVTLFQDRSRLKAQSSKKKSARRTAIDDYAHTTTRIGLTTYDICILGCMLLNVATKGSIASFETMGISYAASDFDISPALAGTYVATCGTVGVIALLSMGYFAAHFTDIQLISGGILVMVTGIISLVPTGHDPEENSSWRYVFAIFMVYAIGYPIGHTALLGLFSKSKYRPSGQCDESILVFLPAFYFVTICSCGTTTSGVINGLVRCRRLFSPHSLSGHVWICRQCRYQESIHHFVLDPIGIGVVCRHESQNVNTTIVITCMFLMLHVTKSTALYPLANSMEGASTVNRDFFFLYT